MPTELAGVTFYTLPEIGEELDLTVFTLRSYIKSGKLKAIKLGRAYQIEESVLKDFLLTGSQSQKPGKKPGRKRKAGGER